MKYNIVKRGTLTTIQIRGQVRFSDEPAILATDGVDHSTRPFMNTSTGMLAVYARKNCDAEVVAINLVDNIRAHRLLKSVNIDFGRMDS